MLKKIGAKKYFGYCLVLVRILYNVFVLVLFIMYQPLIYLFGLGHASRLLLDVLQDLKDYMRQAGEVTYADAHKQRRNEG